MTTPRYVGPPEWQFGQRLGLFISSISGINEEVEWWIARFSDVIGNEREGLRPKHEAFAKLRRRVAAMIPASKVQAMDEILDLLEWKETDWSMAQFTSGYWGYHRPLGSDFWTWFRLRGFDRWQPWMRERWVEEYQRKGIDIVNG